jgi:hypothetical protein
VVQTALLLGSTNEKVNNFSFYVYVFDAFQCIFVYDVYYFLSFFSTLRFELKMFSCSSPIHIVYFFCEFGKLYLQRRAHLK